MEEINETWKEVPETNGEYFISNYGSVLSLKWNKRKILKNTITHYGYYQVVLNGKPYRVHRLVAIAFINNTDNKKDVNHIDGNKLNNHVSNLEWCSNKENNIHKYKTGIYKHSEETKHKISETRKKFENEDFRLKRKELIKQKQIELTKLLKDKLIILGIKTYYQIAKDTTLTQTGARNFWIGGNSSSKTIEIIKKRYNL